MSESRKDTQGGQKMITVRVIEGHAWVRVDALLTIAKRFRTLAEHADNTREALWEIGVGGDELAEMLTEIANAAETWKKGQEVGRPPNVLLTGASRSAANRE